MFNCRFRNKKGGKESFELKKVKRNVKIRKGKIHHESDWIHRYGDRSQKAEKARKYGICSLS